MAEHTVPFEPPVPAPAEPGYVTHLELVLSVVKQMRVHQRHYFLRRDRDSLIEAKRLEGEVDRALDRLHQRQRGGAAR